MKLPENSKILFNSNRVDLAISKMATQMSVELADKKPLFLAVMNGGLVFAADLISRISIPLELDHIHATRYVKNVGQEKVIFHSRPQICMKDRHVVLVDDVFDVGITLEAVVEDLRREAESIRIAVLVEKKVRSRPVNIRPDYVGLSAPNVYLFGRGMDYNGWYRNLRSIYQAESET